MYIIYIYIIYIRDSYAKCIKDDKSKSPENLPIKIIEPTIKTE